MSYKTKYARGLCCFFKCKNPATISYATPGHNLKENQEQLFCQFHWDENGKIAGPEKYPERVSRIQ